MTIELRGDERLRRQFVPPRVADDRIHDLDAHLLGELDRVGVDLAVLDRLLPFRLAVEADHLHLLRLAGLLDRRDGPERRRIVDGEDAAQIGMGLERVLGRLESDVLGAAPFQVLDDRDLAGRLEVVGVDHLAESLDPQPTRLGLEEVQHGDLAPRLAEHFDHRVRRFLAAAVIVGRDLRRDLDARLVARDVDREHRHAGRVRLLDHRHDRLRIARTEDDGADLLDEEILHLVALLGDVLVGAQDDRLVAAFLRLGGDVVADDLEERIVERQKRDGDRTLRLRHGRGGFVGIARRAAGWHNDESADEHEGESVFHESCGGRSSWGTIRLMLADAVSSSIGSDLTTRNRSGPRRCPASAGRRTASPPST